MELHGSANTVNEAVHIYISLGRGPVFGIGFWVRLFITEEKQISKGFSFQRLMSPCHQLHPYGYGNNVSPQPAVSVDGCHSDFRNLVGFEGVPLGAGEPWPSSPRPAHLHRPCGTGLSCEAGQTGEKKTKNKKTAASTEIQVSVYPRFKIHGSVVWKGLSRSVCLQVSQ